MVDARVKYDAVVDFRKQFQRIGVSMLQTWLNVIRHIYEVLEHTRIEL